MTPLDRLRLWRQLRRFCRRIGLGTETAAVLRLVRNVVLLALFVGLLLAVGANSLFGLFVAG